ncbi:MAG: response regulator [Betaproteobacteria bacterium]
MRRLEILLADDHAIIRDGLRQILAETDDLVVAGEAANGQQLLEKLAQRTWDALVLDISMPGRNGLDLMRQIRASCPTMPILVLSMHQEEQYAVRALQAGAAGYLTKESDAELLVSVVRKIANGGMYISPAVGELMARSLGHRQAELPHMLLSQREYQVFMMIVAGRGVTDIAGELSLSVKTVSTHKARIMQKMGMTNTAELIHYAIAHRLVDDAGGV